MKVDVYEAEIKWHRKPPSGCRYVGPARFNHQGKDWNKNASSLVVEFMFGNPNKAKVFFAMPDAPNEWLTPGAWFELYDGDKVVAGGRIIKWLTDEW